MKRSFPKCENRRKRAGHFSFSSSFPFLFFKSFSLSLNFLPFHLFLFCFPFTPLLYPSFFFSVVFPSSSLSSSRRLPSRLLLLYFFVLVFFSLHFFRFLSSFWNMSPLPWVAAFNRTKKWRKMKNLISCPVII